MLNFPVAGGTSGHFLGAALATVLLGPWLATLVLAGEVGRMRTALAARGHRPRHLLHGAVTGRLATAPLLSA